jgi:hypothetical protein
MNVEPPTSTRISHPAFPEAAVGDRRLVADSPRSPSWIVRQVAGGKLPVASVRGVAGLDPERSPNSFVSAPIEN